MPAPALRDVQAGFWRSLHTGDADPALVRAVLPSASLDPAARIGVYQEMYVWRLHEVLREDFPKTQAALGEDFESVVRSYLVRHPSTHPSVRHLGARFADFLETDAAVRGRPWLADLARLERARADAFDAPDAIPIRAVDLAAVAPEDWAGLRFLLVPGIDVVRSRWPVHEAWSDPSLAIAPRPTAVRVWRQYFTVFHGAMDDVEKAAFAELETGEPFGAICDAVAARVGEAPAAAEAGALLARWIDDGLIAAAR